LPGLQKIGEKESAPLLARLIRAKSEDPLGLKEDAASVVYGSEGKRPCHRASGCIGIPRLRLVSQIYAEAMLASGRTWRDPRE